MPSYTFDIESYELTADPRGYFTYRLFVTSPAMYHGIRTQAYVYFVPESKVPSRQGWALNVGGLNYDGITIHGYADEKYFESMYHVLQTEDPVSFRYGYKSGDSTLRELYDFAITTADEPTGEGTTETAMALQPLVSAGELDLEELNAEELGIENIHVLEPMEDAVDVEVTAE